MPISSNSSGTALVFDFGASSGRAMLCKLSDGTLSLTELHRFENVPVTEDGALRWNLNALWADVKTGLLAAKEAGGFQSIGVDTWGVDFGLLDESGQLMELPVHYRDDRTTGAAQELSKHFGVEQLYRRTGVPPLNINTLMQLYSLKRSRPAILDNARTLLMMPDLFTYLLTGEKHAERTIASTTQLLDPITGDWNDTLLRELELPRHIFPRLYDPGTPAGVLSEALCGELGLPPVPVIHTASHDTASAVLAIPAERPDFAFLSCGTWSLFGTQLSNPVLTRDAQTAQMTNERGFGGCVTFLKNMIGLWLIQETRRQFRREGKEYSFARMEELAKEAPPFLCLVDPDAPELTPPGDIPARLRRLCAQSGQPIPETDGAVIRCIYESLAMKYRMTLFELQRCTGKTYPALQLLGGGVKDQLLCQMTADACGIPVDAGPVEATALGNASAQFIARHILSGEDEARMAVRASFPTSRFQPENTDLYAAKDSMYYKIAGGKDK